MDYLFTKFYLPKIGNDESDYEDAFALKTQSKLDTNSICAAIADGATESSFAADWAKMLTRAYVKEPIKNVKNLQVQVNRLAKRWCRVVNRLPLFWYAEEKVQLGAFSTLLGVEIFANANRSLKSGEWSAIAVGDSCLFQIRNDNLIISFPLDRSVDFGNSPILISSNHSKNSQVWDKVIVKSADWQTGDVIFLATDALSHWFLSQYELNEHPWEILLGFVEDSNPSKSFKNWVNKTRASGKIKNDDITLLLIKL